MDTGIRKLGKRKDGSWRWSAQVPDPVKGGTAKIEKVFRRYDDAKRWRDQQLAAQHRGDWFDPRQGERPFREVIEAWREGWHRLSPTTKRRYEGIINKYLIPEFGAMPIAKVTHEVVQRFINRLAARDDVAAGTVRNVYAVLRTAMAKGVRMGLVRVNPCTAIDLPRARREPMLFLTAREVRAVAEAIDPQYRVLIYVASYTGLRAGELGGLQRQDIDLLRGVVHVRRSLKDVNGHLELGPTKTHAQRTVTLPKFLREMLAGHFATVGRKPHALVFTMKGGGPLRHGLVYSRYFRRAVAVALPEKHGLRFHDLRHTCASLAVDSGANVKMVQELMGHSSVTITLDRYSHLFPTAHEALADNLSATFSAAEAEQDENASANVVAIGG